MQTNTEINLFSNLHTILPDVLFPRLSASTLMAFSTTSKAMRYNAIATALEKLAREADNENGYPRLSNLLVSLFLYTSPNSPGLFAHRERMIQVLRNLSHCHLSIYENLLVCSLLARYCSVANIREKEFKEVAEFKFKIVMRYASSLDPILKTAIEAVHNLRIGSDASFGKNSAQLRDLVTSYDENSKCHKLDLSKLSKIYLGHEAAIILFPLLHQSLLDVDESIRTLWNMLPEKDTDLVAEIDDDERSNQNLISFLYASDLLLTGQSQQTYIYDKEKFPKSCVIITSDTEPRLVFELDMLIARWCRNKSVAEIYALMRSCTWDIEGLPIACYFARYRQKDLASFLELEFPRRARSRREQLPAIVYQLLRKDQFNALIKKVLPEGDDYVLPYMFLEELIKIIKLRPENEINELLVMCQQHLLLLPKKINTDLTHFAQFFILFFDHFKNKIFASNLIVESKGITPYSLAKEICQAAYKWPVYSQMEAALLFCIQQCAENKNEILAIVDSLAMQPQEDPSANLSFLLLKLRLSNYSAEDYNLRLKALYKVAIKMDDDGSTYLPSAFWNLCGEIAANFSLAKDCYELALGKLTKLGKADSDLLEILEFFYQKQPTLLGNYEEFLDLVRHFALPSSLYTVLQHDKAVIILSKYLDTLLAPSEGVRRVLVVNIDNLSKHIFNTRMQISIDKNNDNPKVECLEKLERLIFLVGKDNCFSLVQCEQRLISSLRHPDAVTNYFNIRTAKINHELFVSKTQLCENCCHSIFALKTLCDSAKALAANLELNQTSVDVASQRFSDEQNPGLRAR